MNYVSRSKVGDFIVQYATKNFYNRDINIANEFMKLAYAIMDEKNIPTAFDSENVERKFNEMFKKKEEQIRMLVQVSDFERAENIETQAIELKKSLRLIQKEIKEKTPA